MTFLLTLDTKLKRLASGPDNYYPGRMNEQYGERTFTTFEVARLCGVFHTTVINWVNKGKLKARVTPGGHRRIPLSELVPFMKKYDMPVPVDIDDPHSRVLILDDEPMMTRLIEKGFAKHKDRYVLQLSNNPVDALVQVGKRLPDLLVMDLMMPVMDGFGFRERQQRDPAIADIPVVVLSADVQLTEKRERLGQVGLLKKPVDIEEMLSLIKQHESR